MDEMSGVGPLRIARHRALPHWYRAQAVYFITFRLEGSVPREVAVRLLEERKAYLDTLGATDAASLRKAADKWWFVRVEHYLHRTPGMFLDESRAAVVAEALQYHDGQRHDLIAWCVMPNHVHVVTRLREGWDVARVTKGWKGYTSRAINQLARSRGTLWQKDYYEHLVRDDVELWNTAFYTLRNPGKAGLTSWRWVGVGTGRTLAELHCGSLANL